MALINPGSFVNIQPVPDPVSDFAVKYQIRDIKTEQPYSLYSSYGYFSHPGHYTSPRDTLVTITLSERALEALVQNDRQGDRVMDRVHREEFIRSRCPAVQKAWEEYQVLLELAQ